MGLGRVRTFAAVARVEYHGAILYHDSQVMLRARLLDARNGERYFIHFYM
jgi:hypothetical protein